MRHVPTDWSEGGVTADLPVQAGGAGMFSGVIGPPAYYSELHAAAEERGVVLLNDPRQSKRARDLARWYPRVEALTARSVVVRQESDLARVPHELGWPVFVKGAVKRTKEAGWEACVARDANELRLLERDRGR